MPAFQWSQRAFLQATVVVEYGGSLYAVDHHSRCLETAEIIGLVEVHKCNAEGKGHSHQLDPAIAFLQAHRKSKIK